MPKKEKSVMHNVGKDVNGIGVEKCLQGKVIFITGATGFFGKVIVEKILRSIPAVSKIYVLIRAKDKEAAEQRLKNEIVDVELFKCLRKKYGEAYEGFMMSKLVPVVGNVCESDLGLESDSAIAIMKDVHIILNSAADTEFDQRYDVALEINAMGPYKLLDFAKKCKKLELFVQVSSASIKRCSWQGRIMEKLCVTADETFISKTSGRFLPTSFLENEMKLALNYRKTVKDIDKVVQNLKELGFKRAKEFGWPNSYSFTKAIGEMLIEENRGEIPVVILRPSGILSTYKEPFPGWIEGIKLIDPVILNYGKGQLTGFLFNPNCFTDIIPADIVANATLVAIAKHIGLRKKGDNINIYHAVTSISNPIVSQDLAALIYQHFKHRPLIDKNGMPIPVSNFKTFTSMEAFVAYLWREVTLQATLHCSNSNLTERIKFIDRAKYMAILYAPYNLSNYWFDDSNTRGLLKMMSEEEKKKFGCDVKSIDWKDYIVNVHIPGLRRHILKEKGLSKI